MNPILIFIIVYLIVGLLVLGLFDLVDEWVQEARTHLTFAHFSAGILGWLLWPIVFFAQIL